ncbi:ubiquitin carboxyl-terminal hydrolase 40-like [Babylonia areolata]|uniref:ubiquitin carboxyl-terminal hydrolase 40-like n=1 Tax=Babylonia areolata TaxID=304850 RepID=UPI003FD48E19
MFGNLFDEEGGGDGPRTGQSNTPPPPPSPRGRTALAGIWNQGSTCFLNTFLQTLSFLPEFRDAMFQLSAEELRFHAEDIKRRRVIPIELQKLFASLMMEEQQAVSSKLVTDSFGWGNEVQQQHDVQELSSVLLPALHDSLRGTSGQNIIRDLMHITTVQKIQCRGCSNITEKEAEESTLFVQVEGFPKGLGDSLHNAFCTPEMMIGENRYRCDICQCHTDAEKSLKLRKLPPLLMLALNRFATDKATWRAYKVIDQFPFPMELDMGRYMENGRSDSDTVYELTAVIVHSGNCGGGHYTACIRDIDGLGHWETPGGDTADQSQIVKKDLVECFSAVQVVATILHKTQQRHGKVTLDRLSTEISRQTGVSWAKQYKRRYGAFPKFLKDHSEYFLVDQNLVSLVEETKGVSGTEGMSDKKDVNANPVASKRDNRRAPKDARHGQNWFFFNDANVAPMLAEELKNDYGGRKSAYMLMYRLKNLQRPTEAGGNPEYGIPQHLKQEIDTKNQELLRTRQEYERVKKEQEEEEERKKREVEVEIHYHFNYKVENGMLTTDNGSIRESLPRSQTLGELMTFISMLSSGHLEEGFHLHRMKCWGNKTHLYDELTEKEKTLEELSVESGTMLFAWDGHQVDGQSVCTGVESEPLILQLKEYCSPRTVTHAFPKNTTLIEFRTQVSKLTGIPEDQLKLQFPEVVVKGDDENRGELDTLESLRLTDKACILFDGSNRATFGVDLSRADMLIDGASEPVSWPADDRFCIHIENRCDRQSKDSPVLELEVENCMTVEEVKQLFMTMYSIQCDSTTLNELHPIRGMQQPYDERVTVGKAGITSTTHLVLDLAAMSFEFKLYPDPAPDQPGMQVTIQKNSTVQECFLAMAQVAGLSDPSDWHLCTSNFMFDRINVLEDWDMVLFSNCHFFVLEKGRLLPKGHISLPVWLYPSPSQMFLDAAGNMDDLIISDYSKPSTIEPAFLGDVEIDKDSKLDVLRIQVAELLAKKRRHAIPAQLRLRIIEGKHQRLRRVLRDPNNTLRRLKVENKQPIGVEIVNVSANPCKEEIVLNIQVRKAQDKTYELPQELLWDTRCGTSAAKLKQDIASRLMVPDEVLVIAKHFPNECQWRILKDTVQPQTARGYGRGRGKRRSHGGPKHNICQKPFYVEDGDIIGVISQVHCLSAEVLGTPAVSVKGVTADDFSTEEDTLARAQLEEDRRKKQLERQGRCFPNGLSVARIPEVALKIQVHDYS